MIRRGIALSIILSLVFLSACRKEEGLEETPASQEPYLIEHGLLPPPSIPTDNPLTIEGVKLGRMLFYEKKLSRDGTQSCGDCHRQEHAFTDTAKLSIGIAGLPGKRNSMAVFNMLWNFNGFFWDGRAELLRHQALLPIQDPLEMDETLDKVVAKLSAIKLYQDQFQKAFGSTVINEEKIALALEQFMNSLVSSNSKYDQYLAGKTSLSPSEENGRKLYFTEYNAFFPDESGADCAHCHGGLNFSNNQYMNNGLDNGPDILDEGRKVVTGFPGDRGKFKVTSLRNIGLTAPYMHDGRFKTLKEVIDHYDHGLNDSPNLNPALRSTMGTGLRLTEQQKNDLIAFLLTLTDYEFISDPRFSNPH